MQVQSGLVLSLDDPKGCFLVWWHKSLLTIPDRGIFSGVEENLELSFPVDEIFGWQGVIVKIFLSWDPTVGRLLKHGKQ